MSGELDLINEVKGFTWTMADEAPMLFELPSNLLSELLGPVEGALIVTLLPGRLRTCAIDAHRRFKLAVVAQQCSNFCFPISGGTFNVIRQIWFPQKERRGAMRGGSDVVIEVRVPGSDNGSEGDEAGSSMIGVEAVATPWIVTQDHIRTNFPYGPHDIAARVFVIGQLTIDAIEEDDVVRMLRRVPVEESCRSPALCSAGGNKIGKIGVGIPAPLGPIGENEVHDPTASLGPSSQGGPSSELDVVGMSSDGQSRLGHRKVDRHWSAHQEVADRKP
jgi:hypothetical protein